MIRHCVLLCLRPDASDTALATLMQALEKVVDRIPGCGAFCHGPNRDFEGKSPDHPYGFTLDAQDATTLAAYADDSEHRALGAQLVALCQGAADGIVVYDIDVAG